jgi:hypothetical protein
MRLLKFDFFITPYSLFVMHIIKQQPYIILTLIIWVSVIASGMISPIYAQQLTYHEIRGEESFYYHYDFQKSGQEYYIHVARLHQGDTTDKQILVTDQDFNTISWRYIRFGEETDVLARRLADEEVLIEGVLDGDDLRELEELDDDEPWIQLFPMNPGFDQFVFSGQEEMVFWSIGTESPADMEINSFSAEKMETKYSEEFGCTVLRVNFSPSGWRSMFWDGDYYFRTEDARVMGYRGDGAPGKPSSKTTLVDEKP